jgi:hypothetical protein
MQIEQIAVDALIPYARNARTHSDDQIAAIAASIREFGFNNPVLIDADAGIIAGHGRVMAARKLGMETVPCVRLEHLNEAQRRAYILADNRLALNAGWDEPMLGIELSDLFREGVDLSLLGFGDEELARFMDGPDFAPAGEPISGIEYQEKFSVLVECESEAHQSRVYDHLQGLGLICKVLVN